MNAKYLVQIATKNPQLGVNGFMLIDGAMTRAEADDKAFAIRDAEMYARGIQARAVRVITPAEWLAENRAAFEQAN
jgi:hypothetical protein